MAPIRDPNEDVVKSGAFRLTWVSGTIAGIAGVVTVFNEQFIHIFGEHASDGVKASVLIAIIAAWALIAVADLLARAITTTAKLRREPSSLVTAPKKMRVKVTGGGEDSPGWTVAAIRGADGSEADALNLLVVKSGQAPKWVKQDEVVFED
jgi:hypothetical protein